MARQFRKAVAILAYGILFTYVALCVFLFVEQRRRMGARQYPYFPVRLLARDPYDTRDIMERIKVPVLIFHGIDDPVIPFEMGQTLANHLGARATFVPMANVGHYPHGKDLSGSVIAWATARQIAPQAP